MTFKTKRLADKINRAVRGGKLQQGWELLEGHWDDVLDSRFLALAWLHLMDADEHAEVDREKIETALKRWEDDPGLAYQLCYHLLGLVDGRHPDAIIPEDDPSRVAIPYLLGAVKALDGRALQDPDRGGNLWTTLGHAYRLAGPEHDEAALDAYSHALATENRQPWRFNLGLFFKNRRRWEEGTRVFKELFDEDWRAEEVLWNVGICATALGDNALALKAWQAAEYPVSEGEDGRPKIDKLGQVKVRIPAHPENAPDTLCYEYVWVQPTSPCHGRVLNPSLYVSAVEVHDVVLWDGQPIGYAQSGGHRVPRFAMLEHLDDGGWRTFRFRAEQFAKNQISDLSDSLPHESSLYVFEEQVVFLCPECVRTGGPHREDHAPPDPESPLVSGKILVSPETGLAELRDKLKASLAEAGVPVFAVPDLYLELGDDEAAEAERQKWDEL